MSFPRALKGQVGAKKYVGVYRAPFQEPRLNRQQEHALRACSLLAIPLLPPGQEALPGGVVDDLSQVNFSAWAETVQDVAAGMLALPPNMPNTLFPGVQELLVCLDSATRVPFCHTCYQPGNNCRCLGVPYTVSTPSSTTGTSWSEIADPTPIYGVPTSTPQQGAPSVAPLPGLHPPEEGSIWNPPHPDFPVLPWAPGNVRMPRPPARRGATLQAQLQAAQERRAVTDVQYVLPLLTWTQSATPYIQQVQPPVQPPPPLPPPPHSDSAKTTEKMPAPQEQRGRSDAQPSQSDSAQSRTRDRAQSRTRGRA